jgi:tetratricopeptide (TPR) repeat protein
VLARFSKSAGEYLIGSDPACDIVLEIDGVALRHARLRIGGTTTITALESGATTYVDRKAIFGEWELRPLQSMSFGNAEGELRLEGPVAPTTPPTDDVPIPSASQDSKKETAGADDSRPTPWEEPALTGSNPWAEAILLGAIEPRRSDIFSGPPVAGGEVSVSWTPQEPPAPDHSQHPSASSGPGIAEELHASSPPAPVAPSEPPPITPSPSFIPSTPDLSGEETRVESADKVDPAGTGSDSPRPIAPVDRTSLLSLTNNFLLKKLAASGESRKELAALTKDLKQRELALVEAWSRRQSAEERCLELSRRLSEQQGGTASAPSLGPNVRRLLWLSVAMVTLFSALLVGKLREASRRARDAESVVLLLKTVAPQLHREAEAALLAGRMDEAQNKIERALALDPNKAAYYLTLGNIHESLLHIPTAQTAYERAVNLQPSLVAAQENLELCQRISATRGGIQKIENLYGLHRLMLDQNRLAEALRIAQRIGGDGVILHRTWQAILQASGIRGDLRLNDDNSFDLNLFVGTNSDLSPLRGLPLRSLKASRANISDLSALSGMALRQLDLSETMVRDISVLRGMPLEALDLSNTAVTNLVPLHGMPLSELRLDYTGVTETLDLAGLPLRTLSLMSTPVRSIAGLAQMPLRQLNLARTAVRDLTTLKHAPLEDLNLEGTLVTDLTPLAGAPLVSLKLSGTAVTTLEPLRGSPLRE